MTPPSNLAQSSVSDPIKGWVLAGFLGLMAVLTVAVSAYPQPDKPIAVIFAPWEADSTIFAKIVNAGGTPLGFGQVSGVAIAISDDPFFRRSLRAAGAIVMLDATLAAAICNIPLNDRTSP